MIIKKIKKVAPRCLKIFYRKLLHHVHLCSLEKRGKSVIGDIKHLPANKVTSEYKEIIEYFKKNTKLEYPWSMYPYPYVNKYKQRIVTVYTDDLNGMKYVMHEKKRLYYKRSYKEEDIIRSYRFFYMEQNEIDSPHKYESFDFYVSPGDVVVDAGVAEGNFSLSIVERVKHLYLFESDTEWIEALQLTFAPYKAKVTIVNVCISEKYENGEESLDHFFGGEKIDFIKADIEGYETQLLQGAKNLLAQQNTMKIVLCTYHKHSDAEDINNMLTDFGFKTEFSKGYMIFVYDKTQRTVPLFYLRRCLIRARK